MIAPAVKAKQDFSVFITKLSEEVMSRRRRRLAEQRLIPREAARDVGFNELSGRRIAILVAASS